MLNADEILGCVIRELGRIYERPMMYGGDANGVEVVLRAYHWFWALVIDRQEDLAAALDAQLSEVGCGARHFSGHYREHLGRGCEESEAVWYSVSQWRRIDERLGLVVPAP